MSNRITQLQMISQYVADLQNTQSKMAQTQRVLSTNQRINAPSDDPLGTSQMLTFDAQLRDVETYQQNVSDARSFVEMTFSALGGVTDSLKRIRELVLQAANTPSVDQSGMNSIAQEIRQLKEKIRDDANTQYGSQYIFSGTATTTTPYPSGSNLYAGAAPPSQINRRVSPGLSVGINVEGPNAFGTTTGPAPTQMSMLDLCDRIVADLTSGLPADREELRTTVLTALDTHIDTVLQEQAGMSAVANRLDVTEMRLQDLDLRLRDARSSVADADMAKAYLDFQAQNTMYQAALAAGSRIMQTSLVDFL